MSTDTINRASLTPALVRYLRRILDEQPPPGEGSLLRVPPGTTGTRVAGQAERLGVVTIVATIHGDKVARNIPKIREALRVHDRWTLPDGVKITTGYAVLHNGEKIGEVGRSGAGRGQKVRYYGRAELAGVEIEVKGLFDDRVQAGRAVCKARGMTLPGEE